jgi:hypothetical protein
MSQAGHWTGEFEGFGTDRAVDVVGLTVAEFIPRQVMHLQQVVEGFPLIG